MKWLRPFLALVALTALITSGLACGGKGVATSSDGGPSGGSAGAGGSGASGGTGGSKPDGSGGAGAADVVSEPRVDASDGGAGDANRDSADARADASVNFDVADPDARIAPDTTDTSSDNDVLDDTNPDGFSDGIIPTVCGNGKIEGNEQCDDGNTSNGDGCSGLCTDQTACDACLALNCPDYVPEPIWPLCGALTGTATQGGGAGRPRKDLCQETYTCLLRTQCVNWDNRDINPCYCGTTAPADCLAGQPVNGPCMAEIENGMETSDRTILLPNMGNPMYAAGEALRVRLCGQTLCKQECGLPSGDAGTVTDSGAADMLSQ